MAREFLLKSPSIATACNFKLRLKIACITACYLLVHILVGFLPAKPNNVSIII